MRLQILSPSDAPDSQYVSSYLVNDVIAIDAGSIGTWSSPDAQAKVRHIFLTHTHSDHVATLPIFIENVFTPDTPPVVVHGSHHALESLRCHVFNDVIWPDFIRLSNPARPFLVINEVHPEQPVEVEGLRVVPVEVSHNVPTLGYIVTDGNTTLIFGADSGPTQRIWDVCRAFPEPRTVVLETAFPDAMADLARVSAHLTPALVRLEVPKMPPVKRIISVHLKVRFRHRIEEELLSLGLPELIIGECGPIYDV